MIRSVGIDFGIVGPNRVRCLDEQAQLCGSFSFRSSLEGLAAMEERIFQNGTNPTIVFEPTGLAWLLMAIYLKARHPDCRLVRAKTQKVAALRKYLRGRSKSDQIDALTLAKMPFIDPEQLDEVYLPPAEVHALQRLTRQHDRLKKSVGSRKSRLGATIDGYLPGLRHAFNNHWSLRARSFYRSRINPFTVVRAGEEALSTFLNEAMSRGKGSREAHYVYMACQSLVTTYELSMQSGVVDEDFFADLQDEIARELRLMEAEEAEAERLSKRIEELYQKLHPSNNLRSIPGVGEHTAPIFLAGVGNPHRFRNQSAFANWNGVVPGARQSSNLEAKGLRMTKAGPPIMRCSLFLAGEVGRQWDPHLARVYHRAVVYHGKNHKQAMGAVMSHLASRILAVMRDGRPYELRDVEGRPISGREARKLILSKYQVSEEMRRERRRRNYRMGNDQRLVTSKEGMTELSRIHEAAFAPQPAIARAIPKS